MEDTWVTSDQHFFHNNIIKYADRPYSNVDEMNETIIKNWNSVIFKHNIVWILGDFCFGGNQNKLISLTQKLNGRKFLILGNHDRGRAEQFWIKCGFEFSSKYPILQDNRFILSHRPISTVVKPFFNIHGHLHKNSKDDARYYNASVDVTDFYPVNLNLVKSELLSRTDRALNALAEIV